MEFYAGVSKGLMERMERCSDGSGDQGAEEALWGERQERIVSFVWEAGSLQNA